MRLIFFGDSLTEGDYGGKLVDEIARLLPNHEVINAGVGGDTVVNLLSRLESDVLSRDPDGVFVMVGGNDMIAATQPQTRNYYRRRTGAPDGVMTMDLFARTYRDLLTHLQLAHVMTWIGLEPVEYNPETVAAQRTFNDQGRDIATSLGIPVLDLMAAFPPGNPRQRPPLSLATIRLIGERIDAKWADFEAERQREDYTFSFDGFHLTSDAAKQVARLIVDFLDLPA